MACPRLTLALSQGCSPPPYSKARHPESDSLFESFVYAFSLCLILHTPNLFSSLLTLFPSNLLLTLLPLRPTCHHSEVKTQPSPPSDKRSFLLVALFLQSPKFKQRAARSSVLYWCVPVYLYICVCGLSVLVQMCVFVSLYLRLWENARRRSAVKEIQPTAARWPARSRPALWQHKLFHLEILPSPEAHRSSHSSV